MGVVKLLVRLTLIVAPVCAMAVGTTIPPPSTTIPSSYLVAVATSECTTGCDAKYFQCTKGKSGRDMKQCADERRACYQRCSAAASRTDCKKGCDGGYAQCGKSGSGKDMRQCAKERKACYQRCS